MQQSQITIKVHRNFSTYENNNTTSTDTDESANGYVAAHAYAITPVPKMGITMKNNIFDDKNS